ncbi:ferredoxin [Microbacterium lacus]|uniref:Ferredoxin n=1 Tax=Microbacterium lacus TaxID=415217 RepID=A0ABP4S077_9MICO
MTSVSVRRETCVGAGQCALVAGDVFNQDDNGIVVLLQERPDGKLDADVKRAAALCPARAIDVDS